MNTNKCFMLQIENKDFTNSMCLREKTFPL
nr:MAG TPA: hypothetical protein [Caudoviricetes sp.]